MQLKTQPKNIYIMWLLFQDSQTLRAEADESHRKSSHLTRENQKLQQQIRDLSEQVLEYWTRNLSVNIILEICLWILS